MAKKIKVVALVGANHIITQLDLEANPHLVTLGVKVGDEVEIGNDVQLKAENDKLKADKDASTTIVDDLSINVNHLNDELKVVRDSMSDLETTKNSRINDLEKELEEAKEKLSKPSTSSVQKSVANKVIVHHAVIVGGKKFTKEQIEADTSIQEVLLEMGSTAVTKIEG